VTQTNQRDRLTYLREWVGEKVLAVTANSSNYTGRLTNIVFDDKRLMYIMLDDRICLNFDHIVEIRLEK
jgi:RNase P/RNase MRP subunit p29